MWGRVWVGLFEKQSRNVGVIPQGITVSRGHANILRMPWQILFTNKDGMKFNRNLQMKWSWAYVALFMRILGSSELLEFEFLPLLI